MYASWLQLNGLFNQRCCKTTYKHVELQGSLLWSGSIASQDRILGLQVALQQFMDEYAWNCTQEYYADGMHRVLDHTVDSPQKKL